MNTVWFVVPASIDDPARPSGGNRYDRRLADELRSAGWTVRERRVRATTSLATVLASIPDGSLVLVDGLLASVADDVLVPAARRVRLVVLVHMPIDGPSEAAVLAAAAAVITTSEWTRATLVARYELPAAAVRVAAPGTDRGPMALGTPDGTELLCVAAVAPWKGQAELARALVGLADREWRLTCVGSLERAPDYVRRLRAYLERNRLADRVSFRGPLTGAALTGAYTAADVLLLASAAETFGMVVTEAIGHGIPVIAAAVGGVPAALGRTGDGRRPGVLVAPADHGAFTAAIGGWLDDADRRRRLRAAARDRRRELTPWTVTAERVAVALTAAATCEVAR